MKGAPRNETPQAAFTEYFDHQRKCSLKNTQLLILFMPMIIYTEHSIQTQTYKSKSEIKV